MKAAFDFAAAKKISVHAILKGTEIVGRIITHHGEGCTTSTVNVWLPDFNFAGTGSANGGNYNMESAAIATALKGLFPEDRRFIMHGAGMGRVCKEFDNLMGVDIITLL